MVTEKPDAGKSYQPLPIHEIHKKTSALPPTNVQLAQLNKQLTQLIGHLQRLNHQMEVFQEERKIPHSPEPVQATIGGNKKDYDYLTRKDQSIKIKLRNLGKRRGISKFINGVFIFFWVIGIAAALFAAIVLFFHGPAMI